jgi:hypothetical protein
MMASASPALAHGRNLSLSRRLECDSPASAVARNEGGLMRIVALVLLAAFGAARAEPPTAQFAGAQLGMAEAALEHARAALALHDYPKATQLAAQAALDAQLAWRMSESAAVRRAAVEVKRQAERLRWRGLLAGGRARP